MNTPRRDLGQLAASGLALPAFAEAADQPNALTASPHAAVRPDVSKAARRAWRRARARRYAA
ncbi:MAG: hypothetical protein AAGH87_07355 [Pseudomonadota bacterium]